MGQSKYIKMTLVAVMGLATLALLTACGGGSSGKSRTEGRFNNLNTNGFGVRDCQGCDLNNLIADAATGIYTSALKLEMGLSFFGGAGQYIQSNNQGMNTSYTNNSYSGSVVAGGYMYVHFSQPGVQGCELPPGYYEVETQQPGQKSGQTLMGGFVLSAYNTQYGVPVILKIQTFDLLKISTFVDLDGNSYQLGGHGFVAIEVQDPQYGTCNAGNHQMTTVSLPNFMNM